MEFRATRPPTASHKTGAFVLFRPEQSRDLGRLPVPDTVLRKLAAAAWKAKEFTGKRGQLVALHGGTGGRRLLLVGLGPRKAVDGEALREGAGNAALDLDGRGLSSATFLVPTLGDAIDLAGACVEGAGLALYRFDRLKSKAPKTALGRVAVAPERSTGPSVTAPVKRAAAVVEGVRFARDLGNLPGNIATPVHLAREARTLSGRGVRVRVHDRAAIKRMRMGAFAAVAQGSHNEPRLIEITYRCGKRGAETIGLVGKGVTFDTGGISIKPSASMEEMKFDMCGGAAVLGAVHALRALQLPVNVHALVPASDNMPDGKAYRPGDIIKARNGTTIEVISTDAEGRLLLCDSLVYSADKKPDCIINLATLTGAIVVALGDTAAGLFGNDDALAEELEEAGRETGERLWPMPIFPGHDEAIKSPYSDLRNSGGRWGGACTAAAFLQNFVGDTPWAHLDIAGTAWNDRPRSYLRKGATGFGVRLLVEFLARRA